MLDWEWYGDSTTKDVLLHLILTANHRDGRWKGVDIKRGEVITGRKELSKILGFTERQIRTALTKLKSTNELTIKTTNRFSLIKVNKYEDYQLNDQPEVIQATNKRPTNDHKQECKNVKKKKNNTYDRSFENFWSTYPNKTGKKKAYGIWKKMKPSERVEAVKVLPSHIESEQWTQENGRFIPHPSTWLNRGGWEDEVKPQENDYAII